MAANAQIYAKTSPFCLSVPLWQGYLSQMHGSLLFCMILFFENIFSGKGGIFYWLASDKVQNFEEKRGYCRRCAKPTVARRHFDRLFLFI